MLVLDFGGVITGDCEHEDHVGWIVCDSFSHGVSAQMRVTQGSKGRTDGITSHGDVTLTKIIDPASPDLHLACCKNTIFDTAAIKQLRTGADGADFAGWQYDLTNVIISSVSVGGGGEGGSETVSLNYEEIKWTYTGQDEKGVKTEAIAKTVNVQSNTEA